MQKVASIEQPAQVSDRDNGNNGTIAGPEVPVSVNGKEELLKHVGVGIQHIEAYAPIIGGEKIEELVSLASALRGARVLHINSTPYGGGVAEILRSYIPLLRSLEIDAEWLVIRGEDPFFGVTKGFHNASPGRSVPPDLQGQRDLPGNQLPQCPLPGWGLRLRGGPRPPARSHEAYARRRKFQVGLAVPYRYGEPPSQGV